jgi:hypothetical protein
MFRFAGVSAALIAMFSVAWTGQAMSGSNRAAAAPAVNCAAFTLTVHPGVNPSSRSLPFGRAPDAPRGRHTVSLPLYAGAIPLRPYVGTPYPEIDGDPYLQTASAEYRIADGYGKVRHWLVSAFTSCGWHRNGSWSGNSSVLDEGVTLAANTNPRLSLEMSFGTSDTGGTYFAYGVEEIIYPRRPASSYLHGPFVQVRISLGRATIQNGEPVPHYVQATVLARSAIVRLVSAINSLKGRRTVFPICSGGLSLVGPMWLAFVRRDGSVQHAYETLWGPCGGLAVNGVRGLLDTGIVWKQVIALTGGRG